MLLDTGRAVGAKELRDYLEVAGYGQAARWVYTQALTADGGHKGDLTTVTGFRHIHGCTGPGLGDRSPPGRSPDGNTGQLPAPRHPPLRRRDDTAGLDRSTQ